MLDVGQLRAKKLGFSSKKIDWLQGDAEELPLDDASFTAYTIAFGIRNVTHIDRVLAEAYRVLKPGGRFMCLEFSQLNNGMLQW
jgi:2-methoxy-6-polyprenyl-1,4-benzoquinol methylase